MGPRLFGEVVRRTRVVGKGVMAIAASNCGVGLVVGITTGGPL